MKNTTTVILTILTITLSIFYINDIDIEHSIMISIAMSALWIYTLLRWIVTVLFIDAIRIPCNREWLVKITFVDHKFDNIVTPIFYIVISFIGVYLIEQITIDFILKLFIVSNAIILTTHIRRIKIEYIMMKNLLL